MANRCSLAWVLVLVQLAFLNCFSFGQSKLDEHKAYYINRSLDSIEQLLQTNVGDSLRFVLLIQKSRANLPHNPRGAIKFFTEALDLAYVINDSKPTGFSLGIFYGHYFLSNLYATQGNLKLCSYHLFEGLALADSLNDSVALGFIYHSLGLLKESQGNIQQAIESYNKALQFRSTTDWDGPLGMTLNNIGYAYIRLKMPDSAAYYLEKAALINEAKPEFSVAYSYVMYNLGNVQLLRTQYNEAIAWYRRSEQVAINDKNSRLLGYIYNSYGEVYRLLGKLDSSEYYYQQTISICEKVEMMQFVRDAWKGISLTFREQGAFEKALNAYERFNFLADSILTTESKTSLERLEASFDFEKEKLAKEHAHLAELNKRDNFRNVLIFFAITILLLATGLFSRLRSKSRAKDIIEKEKDRSERLLLNILPADVATELKETGRSVARDFKLVSILFTDFKDFTEQSEKLTAAELVSEINHCFEAFDAIVERHGIEKIKTIGDAYMAAGGLPVPTANSVRNTVLAALDMQAFIQKRKAEKEALGQPAFEMRVGIHSGPVVAGIVGVKKFQYDIWGDTVNTASRIESSGEVGKVNVSQSTYELLKEDQAFEFESRGKVAAKGKGEIEMLFVSLKT
ncbi:MAG: adenylate/guanylate cyclase domain-containing protein [Bacteroidia bacterium]